MLRVIPHRRHSITIVVTHDELASETLIAARGRNAGKFDELVHQSGVEGALFAGIIVALAASHGLGAGQAEWLFGIPVIPHHSCREAADDGTGIGARDEGGLAPGIRRIGVGGKVVIERDVLLKNHDHVFDATARFGTVLRECERGTHYGKCSAYTTFGHGQLFYRLSEPMSMLSCPEKSRRMGSRRTPPVRPAAIGDRDRFRPARTRNRSDRGPSVR